MKGKVLVVDNNKVILRLLSAILDKLGYQVQTAENGLQALDVLETFSPTYIFVDLVMPKMNGKTLCRLIRKMPEFDQTFLIIISAIAAEEQLDFLSFGANACIAKGSAGNMKENIIEVLDQLEKQNLEAVSHKIFGSENVFEREITKELLAANRHFEITLNNMADGFFELTEEGRIIFANKSAATIFNRNEEELLSQYFPDLFAEEQKLYIKDTLQILSQTPIEIGEEEPVKLNGYYLLIKFVRVSETDHHSISVMIQNITHRKQLEHQLLKHHEELEQKIAIRTADYERANIRLQKALSKVKLLSGFLPICASCKKIRDDNGYWNQIESYICKHSEAEFSHGLCPECAQNLYPEFLDLPIK